MGIRQRWRVLRPVRTDNTDERGGFPMSTSSPSMQRLNEVCNGLLALARDYGPGGVRPPAELTRARVMDLLDEVRDVIATLEEQAPPDRKEPFTGDLPLAGNPYPLT